MLILQHTYAATEGHRHHFREAPKCVRTFLASRESVSLSSTSASLSFFWVLFLPVLPAFPEPFSVAVADVGVGWFDPLSFSLFANVVETGVGAAGVDVAEGASVLSG